MMQVTCVPREDLESCQDCLDKKKCEAYWLIMDLTAERNICPYNIMMEKCALDGSSISHTLEECEGLASSELS